MTAANPYDPAAWGAARPGQRGLPRLAGLDGIRGLAALAVVLYHAGAAWLPAGYLGVDVFFVVSGFLITSLLLAEREQDGATDLAEFWRRRARRLLPVLALVLLVTTCYAALALPNTLLDQLRELLAAAVYLTNWDQIVRGVSYFEMFERPSQLRHLWSLAVEEQFYIVWPLLFATAARLFRLRWLWCIVIGLAALSALWMALLFSPGDEPSRVYFGSDARAFTMLIGVAAAFVWKPWRWRFSAPLGRLLDLLALAALVGLGWIMAVAQHWDDWLYPWGLLAVSAASMVLVAGAIRPGSLVGHALEATPLRWLGERSYSIYLWHWPVLLALQWEYQFVPNTIAIVAVGVGATLLLAELSYRFVEQPMRRAGFWNIVRLRNHLAAARPLAAVAGSLAAAVLLALVIAYALLPGRSLSDLWFAAAAEQSAGVADVRNADHLSLGSTERPLPVRPAAAAPLEPGAATEPSANAASVPSAEVAPAAEPRRAGVPPFMRPIDPDADPAAANAAPSDDEPAAEHLTAYPPGEYFTHYTVQAGDSLNGLSAKFATTIAELVALNGEQILEVIHPGDVLHAPCPGEAPCAFLELVQQGVGCVQLESAADVVSLCRSQTLLVELPLRLSVRPENALSSLPRWDWRGVETEGLEFVLRREHTEPFGEAATRLELRHGRPPLAVGDSVMVGAQEQLEAVGIRVQAEVGRSAEQALNALKREIARHGVPEVVIFQAVGRSLLDAAGFESLLEVVQGARHLIVLTRQFPPREPLLSYERDINAMLREEVPKYDWVTLLDWNAITNGREDELTWDGTHLNPLGRQLYADHILAAILSRPPPLMAAAGE